jgi:hypothetical protein
MRVTNNPEEIGTCGCGRSPTGKCIGWHGLNAQQLQEARKMWDDAQAVQASSARKLDITDVTVPTGQSVKRFSSI